MWRPRVVKVLSRLRSAPTPAPAAVEAEARRLEAAFVAGDTRRLAGALGPYLGCPTRVAFDQGGGLCRFSFRLICEDGALAFGFVPQPVLDDVANLVFVRFMGTLPLLAALAKARPPVRIDAVFNMNDEGVDDGIAFCDHRETFTLVPDNFFLESGGYAEARAHFQGNAVAWGDRRDAVLWRGASSGRLTESVRELPRVTLCRLCRSDRSGAFDVGLTAVVAQGLATRALIEAQGLVVPTMHWSEFGRYRYHIDIDGHSNSWPGLMLKLLTGGLVFKVAPPFGHRQWYYDRLRPFENYVPVRSDLGDLAELVGYFRSRQDLAREIGLRGQHLVLSMTRQAEIDYGVRAIVARSVRDAAGSRALTEASSA